MRKYLLLILILINGINVNSQDWNINRIFENYIISLKAGSSMVLTEYKRDLSGIINEMNHRPDFTFSAGISKIFAGNWEIGYEYELSYFQGFQNNPYFSAYQFGHYKISLMRLEPVIYRSHLTNQNIVFTYHFNTQKEKRIIPFIYLKGGFSKILSELKYQANNEVIFSKMGRDETKPNTSIYIDNYNFGIGAGAEYIINSKLSLNFQVELINVNDDNLDAVHNFKAPPPEGYINYVSGIYIRSLVSISYNLNPDRLRIASRNYLLKDSFNKKSHQNRIFPWHDK